MQIYTPDELLHQQHAERCQHDRFMARAINHAPVGNGRSPLDRKQFGQQVQTYVAVKLREDGYSVSAAPANEHYDLLVNGLRIEVKAAALSGHRYAAALRSNDADVLIFYCESPLPLGEGQGEGCYFVIPFNDVRGLTHIKISQPDPRNYTGRYRDRLNDWSLIDTMIARGVNHWQLPLM